MNAIEKTLGPCVILAGAGTGKTYTIVEKIKYLIEQRVYKPERIVCMTFSNEAANELLKRVRKILGVGDEEPIVRTFHGFSADLLRKYGSKIGVNEAFSILDPDEAKIVMHRNLKVNAGSCHRYIGAIGVAKDLGISIDTLEEYLHREMEEYRGMDLNKKLESFQFELQTLHLGKKKEDKNDLMRLIKKTKSLLDLKRFIGAWRGYEKIKVLKNYMDYSDLNRKALELLRECGEIAEDYDYLVVDEFQDTNKVQLDIIFGLAPYRNTGDRKSPVPKTPVDWKGQGVSGVTIVGDLNQSIYRFRGAYKENYREFKEHFGINVGDVFNLDMSYRSPNRILRAAHKLILNNYESAEECFEVSNIRAREGENVSVFEMKNGREEARKVVELVKREISEGKELEEICVMFRTHQQGRVIKRLLDFEKIEYCSVSKSSLLKQKSVKTVIDYLTILDKLGRWGKGGEQAWWDLVYLGGFDGSDLRKIGRYIKDNRDMENLNSIMLNSLGDLGMSEKGKMSAKILIERIKMLLPSVKKPIGELLLDVYHVTGLLRNDKSDEGKEVMLNLNKFHEIAKTHEALHEPDLGSFINYLDVVESLGIEINTAELEEKGVRLMTLHATKGLEYKTVIITNMAQRRFPIIRSNSNALIPLELYPELEDKLDGLARDEMDYYIWDYDKKNQEFEERRLCYVAFTRAKEKLILTYARKYGSYNYYPSQFLKEVGYMENGDFNFSVDLNEKYEEPKVEVFGGLELGRAIGSGNFEEVLDGVLSGRAEGEIDLDKVVLSPSSLLLFNECQKKYEYKYVYNMPEGKVVNWEAMRLGSFVHSVLEKGVNANFREVKEFLDLAREMHMSEDWESVELEDAEHLVRVFFERNKDKFCENSRTEQRLNFEIGGVRFTGLADRIDFGPEGLEIIDYKTGVSSVPPLTRNWQLGYYALAASQFGRVLKITLDMLKQEKPLEFEVDEEGRARAVNHTGRMEFNIYEVEEELVKVAHAVMEAYKKGFRACGVEKNCEFCSEYVYGP